MPSRTAIPRVALLVETSRGYGRNYLRGVMRYAREHGPWSFYLTPGDFSQVLPAMYRRGTNVPMGIIARVENDAIARQLAQSGLPVVILDLSDQQRASGILPRCVEVHPDPEAIAQLAIEHMVARGFRAFAFVGIAGRSWSDQRQAAFVRQLAQRGITPHIFTGSPQDNPLMTDQESLLLEWLRTLPLPVAIMACNDDRGRQVLEACRLAHIAVPEDVAVIGVDNDELLCELADPPLSSVDVDALGGGYAAAALLEAMMFRRAGAKGPKTVLVRPTQVIERRSTEILAQENRPIAAALRFIGDQACHEVLVDQVAEAAGLARRTLEVHFRKTMGRTVLQEIRRVQIEKVKQLLVNSALPFKEVARLAGFANQFYMSTAFRRYAGTSPRTYRERMHAGTVMLQEPETKSPI